MTEHSPLPWAQNPSDPTMVTADFDEFGKGLNVAEAWQSAADAAFLVHCVNLHDELVAALETWIAHIDRFHGASGYPGNRCEWCAPNEDHARTLLAKAKGEAS